MEKGGQYQYNPTFLRWLPYVEFTELFKKKLNIVDVGLERAAL